MTHVALQDVVVEFPVARAFRHIVHRAHARATGGQLDDRRSVVRALNNVSFAVREGDRLGIVGHNGAGKSTLLRVAAGIYVPHSGRVTTQGRVSALFNAAPGLEIDDNGWQNIVNCGLYLGMSRAEIAAKANDIAEFTELGEFLDMPVRTYSAGMLTRLSFSIATAIDPEILLLDEALGAGDARFAVKAQQRLDRLVERSAILIMSSHSPIELKTYCNRGLILEKGQVTAEGSIDDVIESYHSGIVARAAGDDREALDRALALVQDMTRRGAPVPLALEEQSLRAALAIRPDDIGMLLRMCQVLVGQSKPVPATLEIRALEAALRTRPNDAAMRKRLADLTAHKPQAAAEVRSPTVPQSAPPGPAVAQGAAGERLLAIVNQMAQRGENIPLALEELALAQALQVAPDDFAMLMRYCQLLTIQQKAVPPAYEIAALEAALRLYPTDTAMAARLRELAAANAHPIADDVAQLIPAPEPVS